MKDMIEEIRFLLLCAIDVVIGMIIVILVMCFSGCTNPQPLTFEQRMALASIGAGLQSGGNYIQAHSVQPVPVFQTPTFTPMQIQAVQPAFIPQP